MSSRTIQQNALEKRNALNVPTSVNSRGVGAGWIRNPTWPALPGISASDEKIVGLYAVYPDSAFATVLCSVSTGTYTVDWGDGTIPQTYTSNTQANYTYDYTAAGLAGTNGSVTFTDAEDLVTRTAHGYVNNQQISFANITVTTGIVSGQIYYVVNATTNTFQLAATMGGTVLPLTGDGSGTILPYKIATVTITPTTPGATLTLINLGLRHTSTTIAYASGWLDLALAASATTITLSSVTSQVFASLLEQVRVLRHRTGTLAFYNCYKLSNIVELVADTGYTLTGGIAMFTNCRNLISIPLGYTGTSWTSVSSMFNGCSSLLVAPLLNTSACTDMSNMFNGCNSLVSVPLYDTSAVTLMTSTFSGCSALTSIPVFNTGAVTSMQSTFSGCTSLENIPSFNTTAVTNMTSMFNGCNSLTTIPSLDTAAVTNMSSMFSGCTSLISVPLFNTAAVTTMSSMFLNCSSLSGVPLFNTAAVTNMSSMFSGCTALESVPLFDTAAVTNMNGMFTGCSVLASIPAFNCSAVVTVSALAGSGFGTTLISCRRISATGIYYTLSVASQLLSGAALDEIYTNLGTVRAAGTAVTFQGTPDTVTLVAHGYTEGRTVSFATVVTTTGITINTNYYVRNPTADTFQLSTTATGAIINLVNNGTGTLNGQVITVTSNWGTAIDTPSIATAKGWTVTGS